MQKESSDYITLLSNILMDDIRYVENPFAKIFNIVNPDTTQLYNLLLKLLN